MWRAVAPILAAASLLAACGPKADRHALFPLEAGREWNYRVTTVIDHEPTEQGELRLRSLGAQVDDALGAEPAHLRRSDDGNDYWLRADASGIYRVASRSPVQARPEADTLPRYVLKTPIAVGTQWQAPTTTYVLRRRSEFPREIRHTHPRIPMWYRIEAVGETVEVPAGRFERCVRVQGTATVSLYVDPAAGWRDLPLTTTEWFCPGVGLVRLERLEPVRSPFLSGGRVTMELLTWQ